MALSGLEQRAMPLARLYLPFGPAGTPPWADCEPGEDPSPSVGADMKRRRSFSHAGYRTWWSHEGLRSAMPSQASDDGECSTTASAADSKDESQGYTEGEAAGAVKPCWSDYEEPQSPHPHSQAAPRWCGGDQRPVRSAQEHEGKADDSLAEQLQSPGGQMETSARATTVMVRKIPRNMRRAQLMNRLDQLGFAGHYNIVNLPTVWGTGKNLGFAFINFVTQAAAEGFMSQFSVDNQRGWAAQPAKVQGYEANLSTASSAKVSRIRSCRNRPLVLRKE